VREGRAVATLHLKYFPRDLLLLLEALAAAEGIELNEVVAALVHEQLYGLPSPASSPDRRTALPSSAVSRSA
jgi:hypothetical protein